MIARTYITFLILLGIYFYGFWYGWQGGLEMGQLREKRRAEREKEWKE